MDQVLSPLFDAFPEPEAPVVAGGWVTARDVLELPGGGRRTLPAGRMTAPRAPIAGLTMDRPRIMGILNITPDSFSDGGLYFDPAQAVARAQKMVAEGADILDIGGESTRPGAAKVRPTEEAARVLPVIKALRGSGLRTPISIDTRNASTAAAALDAGADIINDVSGLEHDEKMAGLAADRDVPICIMHAQGTPETMQDNPSYDDVVIDVFQALCARVDKALAAGISRSRIIVDPGIGFGKTQAHNLALIRHLGVLHGLGCPILLGASRKRFIGAIARVEAAEERVSGSLAVALAGVARGTQILRVHDVAETKQALRLWQAVHLGDVRNG